MTYFSEQLKQLRASLGMTMQDLAEAASVSKSMICKIERDEVQPTLDVAGRLSKALGKSLSEMLHATQEPQVIHLTRKEQAIWEEAQGIKRRNISPIFEGLKIEWLQVELPPGLSISKLLPLGSHGQEKFILVIKGTLAITINSKSYQVKKGDSIYFDASASHAITNEGKEVLEFYVVIRHK